MAYVETVFEEPEIVKFAKLELIGDSVEGIFVGTEERKNNFGKNEVHIKIKTGTGPEGESVIESMRANQRLLAQVAAVKRGAKIRIEYVDDRMNDGVDREGRPLKPTKLFKVEVDDGQKAAPAKSKAQNEDDIPF
jgi:hypothetical protein